MELTFQVVVAAFAVVRRSLPLPLVALPPVQCTSSKARVLICQHPSSRSQVHSNFAAEPEGAGMMLQLALVASGFAAAGRAHWHGGTCQPPGVPSCNLPAGQASLLLHPSGAACQWPGGEATQAPPAHEATEGGWPAATRRPRQLARKKRAAAACPRRLLWGLPGRQCIHTPTLQTGQGFKLSSSAAASFPGAPACADTSDRKSMPTCADVTCTSTATLQQNERSTSSNLNTINGHRE